MTNIPNCNKCGIKMKRGIALENGLDTLGDFTGDLNGITVYPSPKKVKMITCWKCPKCGRSIKKI